ncbi:hypothetical protein ACGFRG_08015 [Streptomyces sp. NPDC048696]|uniref:hypothetical protein n=1 Tax=Streptomyces sp. NPDC048696 TaxID=3365585 RepID=UPI0037151D8A
MARVRFIGLEPVTVPELGRQVELDEVVEVPDDRFGGYVCQPGTWEAVEEPQGWNESGGGNGAFVELPAPTKTTAKTVWKGAED